MGKWENGKKMKTSNVVPSFLVCSNRNRSALVRDVLSYNSLFVGQSHRYPQHMMKHLRQFLLLAGLPYGLN